jgi:hypothetical protein
MFDFYSKLKQLEEQILDLEKKVQTYEKTLLTLKKLVFRVFLTILPLIVSSNVLVKYQDIMKELGLKLDTNAESVKSDKTDTT